MANIKRHSREGWMYFVFDIDNFEDIKPKILNILDNAEAEPSDHVTRTDWSVDVGDPREYFDIIWEHIGKDMNAILRGNLGITGWEVNNVWFHQYDDGSGFDWHWHSNCSFTNVCYIELPDGSKPEFIDPVTKEVIQANVKEGQVLVIPSFIMHRSPINRTGSRKTVVPFNI